MKKVFYLLSVVLLLAACQSEENVMVTYKINEPVTMSKTQFRASVKVTNNKVGITNFGKICFFDGYLYVSESQKGIHIIDNRNPSSPVQVGFIELLGNADLSIRNNLLYADSFVDLVWFDVSNPAVPVLKGRLVDVFPDALPMMKNSYGFDYEKTYEKKSENIVVGWNVVERTEKMEDYRGSWWGWGGGFMEGDFMMNKDAKALSNSGNGINGSMSLFALYDNKLYAVLKDQISIFDLTGETPVKTGDSFYVGWNVETIFSYKTNLFLGTPRGMLIYSVTNPLKPEYMSSVTHAFGCDPVVVENDLAYVTIRSGNTCGQEANDLIIIDVKDVKAPKKLVSFGMTSPRGLGIDAGKLFLCDDGLKIFNITDNPLALAANIIKHEKGMTGFDLIPYNNTLMMIAEDGLYQYDYTDTNNIRLLSKLAFTKE